MDTFPATRMIAHVANSRVFTVKIAVKHVLIHQDCEL